MAETTFTLILTHSIHTVDAVTASAIRSAVASGERLVDVDIDLFGGATSSRKTMLATAHVIGLSEAAPRIADASPQRAALHALR